MKKVALAVSVMVVFLGGFALGDQGWQDNQDGQQFTLTNTSLVNVSAPASSKSAPVTLFNDLGDQGPTSAGLSYYGSLATPACGGPNSLVLYGPPVGFGKYVDTCLNTNLIEQMQLGAYSLAETGNISVHYIQPGVLNGTSGSGYAAWESVNSNGGLLAMAMTSPSVTTKPFTISNAGYLWNRAHGPICLMTDGTDSTFGTCAFELDGSQNITATSMAGSGVRCVQVDASGKMSAPSPCGTGSGTVTSVNGTAGQILCTPTSPNPVCSLVAAGTAGSCTNCSVTFDALGRETSQTSGTAPVVAVIGTAQRVSVSPTTVNPVVDLIGSFYSGAVSSGNQDLGLLATGLDKLTVTAGVAVMSTAAPGTDYQAPISPTSCGANTFGTSVSSAGALTCTQPDFTNLSGSWACSQRPAFTGPGSGNDLSSSAGSCVTSVVAIHDASATQLVFGTIPDSNPQSTVLIRGSGATSITGVTASTIADTVTKHDYFINIQSLQPVDTSTRYLATSSSGTVLPGGVIESPNDFKAGHVGYKFYIIDSVGTASSMDCWVTLNGTLITGTDYNFTPGTTSPGVHTQSTVATGSTSANDTYGMACLYNGNFVTGPFGATIVFTVQLVLTP